MHHQTWLRHQRITRKFAAYSRRTDRMLPTCSCSGNAICITCYAYFAHSAMAREFLEEWAKDNPPPPPDSPHS